MGLLDLVFPARCVGCDAPGVLACDRCLSPLRRAARPAGPRPRPAGLPETWTIAEYDGSVRDLLIGYKERSHLGLLDSLASALSVSLSAACVGAAGPVLVVPVPSSRAAVRLRGDDVVGVLVARATARIRRTGHQVRFAPALRQRPGVQDSAGLTAVARATNLHDALVVRPGWGGRLADATVVIADDLVTTGASLAEAARALRAADADVRAAATIAATARHFGR